MRFELAPELAGIVRPGLLWLRGATVVAHDLRLDAPLAAVERQVRLDPPGDPQAVRTMYRQVGLDPTRHRPSSEALLRRVRKGEGLPRINSLVDVCNWCSLEFQLPYGLYDAARLAGDTVTLRLGRPGEAYDGIRKDTVHVEGRITLADVTGPFGNPSSDSARTMVTTGTTDVLLVVFAPAGMSPDRVDTVVRLTAARMQTYTGGLPAFDTIA